MNILKKHFVWLGILTIVIGFLYDTLYAGIPFQDAPPELNEKYIFNQNVSQAIIILGIALLVIGITAKIIKSKKA